MKTTACLLAAAVLAGCGTVSMPGPAAPDAASLQAQAAALQPGQSTQADAERLWGRPHRITAFEPGHRVWHYYLPQAGLAWMSRLPGVGLATTERGRPAREAVLLFDRQGVLRQMLLRELPG